MSEGDVVEGCWCTTCLGPMRKSVLGEGWLKCIKCGELWPKDSHPIWGDKAFDHRRHSIRVTEGSEDE